MNLFNKKVRLGMILMLNEVLTNNYAAQTLNGYINSSSAKAFMRDELNLDVNDLKLSEINDILKNISWLEKQIRGKSPFYSKEYLYGTKTHQKHLQDLVDAVENFKKEKASNIEKYKKQQMYGKNLPNTQSNPNQQQPYYPTVPPDMFAELKRNKDYTDWSNKYNLFRKDETRVDDEDRLGVNRVPKESIPETFKRTIKLTESQFNKIIDYFSNN